MILIPKSKASEAGIGCATEARPSCRVTPVIGANEGTPAPSTGPPGSEIAAGGG